MAWKVSSFYFAANPVDCFSVKNYQSRAIPAASPSDNADRTYTPDLRALENAVYDSRWDPQQNYNNGISDTPDKYTLPVADFAPREKRHFCRPLFVYNPVVGRCQPTLLVRPQ